MQAANARGILGWGIFTASSWTWCIGLFLPIIMLRLFGWPGFLLFAVPNILGVVVFGYLFDRQRCLRSLREHRPAIRLFSVATVVYQLFFIAWLWSRLLPEGGSSIGAMVGIGAWLVGLVLAIMPDRGWMWLGIATWVGSIALFVIHGTGGLDSMPEAGSLTRTDLLLVAPAIIFGFMLCPWLDASFHRARLRSGSPHTFAIFAIAFAPMILFTCSYAADGMIALDGIVLAQLTMQATFTSAVHLREAWLGGPDADKADARRWPWAALLPGCAVLLGTLPLVSSEATYLRILGLYGLVFPAYALFFMRRTGSTTPNPISLALFALILVPCGIALELAFVGLVTTWVPLAIGSLLVLALLMMLAGRRPRSN